MDEDGDPYEEDGTYWGYPSRDCFSEEEIKLLMQKGRERAAVA